MKDAKVLTGFYEGNGGYANSPIHEPSTFSGMLFHDLIPDIVTVQAKNDPCGDMAANMVAVRPCEIDPETHGFNDVSEVRIKCGDSYTTISLYWDKADESTWRLRWGGDSPKEQMNFKGEIYNWVAVCHEPKKEGV